MCIQQWEQRRDEWELLLQKPKFGSQHPCCGLHSQQGYPIPIPGLRRLLNVMHIPSPTYS